MHAPAPRIIPPELLLTAYRSGIFPMADSREDDDVYWVEPRERGIIPLDGFRCSRSLAKAVARERFRVTCNADFDGVVEACARPRPGHPETWISRRIGASFRALHMAGHAHSLECWRDEGRGAELMGGLYGVGFDRVFCGESMFSRASDASKVALAWLVALLRRSGYLVLDCQFLTEHLASLGAVMVSREEYLALLADAKTGQAPPLPEAYAALLSEAGSPAAGEGSGSGSSSGGEGAGASSPGKLIAQSLTQTS